MGWLPFTTPSRSEEIRTGTAIPTRSERAACWAARDSYYACLDANSIVDANKDAALAKAKCPQQSADFERDCAAAWVSYFKQWRAVDIQKKKRLEQLQKEGAVQMEVTSSFAPEGGAGVKGTGVQDIQGLLEKQGKGK